MTRKNPPEGTRVRLTSPMANDPNPIPVGAQGTVAFVDDGGTVHVDWDDGRKLGLIPGTDRWEVVA